MRFFFCHESSFVVTFVGHVNDRLSFFRLDSDMLLISINLFLIIAKGTLLSEILDI